MASEPSKVKSVAWASRPCALSPAAPPAGANGRTPPSKPLRLPFIGPDDLQTAWLPRPPLTPPTGGLQAVLFDLDGVLVNTAEFHYRAWKRLAEELGLPFDRQANEAFRGVSRMDCLNLLLAGHANVFAAYERQALADRKNTYYLALVNTLRPCDILPGARTLLMQLRAAGIRTAVVSASKNAARVLELLRIAPWFDAIVDGTHVARSKPDPEGFLLAADRLGVQSAQCVVVEDAQAGIAAAIAGGMKTIAIGLNSPAAERADLAVGGLNDLDPLDLHALVPHSALPAEAQAA